MTMRKSIQDAVAAAINEVMPGGERVDFSIEVPEDSKHGDYVTNTAMVLAKVLKKNPMEIAGELAKKLEGKEWKVEAVLPGFINFFLTKELFQNHILRIIKNPEEFGKNDLLKGKKIIIEYTDPNPFKEFHIGHLMPNSIGESLSRILEFCGAEVKRANYQGDVGLHVAKAVWEMRRVKNEQSEAWQEEISGSEEERMKFLGRSYASGNNAYEKNEKAKGEIQEINKHVFERSDEEVNSLYDMGREWSLEYFNSLYKMLGTKFDFFFFESEVASRGKEIVQEGLEKGVFEQSDGAVVFHGEKYGLHTRVFINSQGLPTYEAKELGLAFIKEKQYPHDVAFVVSANEIVEYFKVVLVALGELYPEFKGKIVHVPHGLIRLKGGKISSRTGNVPRAADLLRDVRTMLEEKMQSIDIPDKEKVISDIAVGAVKYSILRQSVGKDIVFDFETSLSFEGDSGPYLQYTYARAKSLLRKAEEKGVAVSLSAPLPEVTDIERVLFHFEDTVARAYENRDPHYITTYLFLLAQAFNNFYAHERIIDDKDYAPYKLALTEAVAATLKNGLNLLGMEAPEKM